MPNGKLHIRWMGAVLALSAAVAFGELHICRKCGYENTKGAIACTHCNAQFPVQDKPATQQAAVVEDATDGYIPQQLVQAEIAEGRKCLHHQKHELARFFFINALALEGVTHPAGHDKRSENLLTLIQSADVAARNVLKTCPRCDGSGQLQVRFEGLSPSGSGSTIGSGKTFAADGFAGVTCNKCDGQGTVYAVGTIDDRKVVRGKAASAYRIVQQARRYEPLGGAWVPPRLADTLTSRQKATIMRSIVLPCEACAGYGRFDCKRCGGLGRTDCKTCKSGRVPYALTGDDVQRIGANRTRKCDECRGTGTLPCRRCDEDGTIVCKDCDGTGDADACPACAARGYLPCKRCDGSRIYRGEACRYCRGEGYMLCPSCKGQGRRN